MTGRWRVRRGRAVGFWWAESPDALDAKHFTTWREAFTYADRAARGGTP